MEDTDPLHALLRQAFCGHVWLMERFIRRLELSGDPRIKRVLHAKQFAEDHVIDAARQMGEVDAFLPTPPAPVVDGVGWFDLGFSALLLELVTLHTLSTRTNVKGEAGNTVYGACGEHFAATRRYAFQQARDEGAKEIEERVARFEIPAVEAWGTDFLKEAVAVLEKRLPPRTLLKEAVATLKAHGLPDDPWRYIEPQLDRYGKVFGIGWARKKIIRAGLWLA